MGLLSLSRWETPMRFAAGSFILNSGLDKRGIAEDAAQQLHGTDLPLVGDMDPETFAGVLSRAEVGLGSALLTPFVPRRLVGMGLTAFSGLLLWMYAKPGSGREAPEGLGKTRNAWLLAIGLALLLARSKDE